ncbi:MAG: polyprenol monophosphomannose synthase [Bifidobacterium sp.]|jgi:dolichol-phosphate mannosyltransferase|nr:polyprenol monophosphomannose synthase [Bifidobacterium sp.]MCI1865104.1 polyprenol monophosphomannose synthase [Bifidobacterium sp.]
MLNNICVVMPTYDELENISRTLRSVLEVNPGVDVLVVDDGSPDGTGRRADELAHADSRIHVLHREGKAGLGPAYVAGFQWALSHGFEVICEMDMDGSHRAQDLRSMLDVLGRDPGIDLVIGSRRIEGGRTENWPWYRDLLSRAGSWYARRMLGLRVRDMTAGLRAYRRDALCRVDLRSVKANGYVFQIDMTRRVMAAGGVVREVPIVFAERTRGRSKMDSGIVVEAMRCVTLWGIERCLPSHAARGRGRGPADAGNVGT